MAVVGPSWAVFGLSWEPLGCYWGDLAGVCSPFVLSEARKNEDAKIIRKLTETRHVSSPHALWGVLLGRLRGLLGRLDAILGRLGALLGPLGTYLPIWRISLAIFVVY